MMCDHAASAFSSGRREGKSWTSFSLSLSGNARMASSISSTVLIPSQFILPLSVGKLVFQGETPHAIDSEVFTGFHDAAAEQFIIYQGMSRVHRRRRGKADKFS